MVPKLCFTFWEGLQFSKLHYMTILSLSKLNPDMKITVYTSSGSANILKEWTTYEHSLQLTNTFDMHKVSKISDKITIKHVDFTKEYGIQNDISPVYKADIIRICKLHEHGGLWFDFDILFIKPLPHYLFDSDVDMLYFAYDIPNGFIITTGLVISMPNTEYLTGLKERMRVVLSDPANDGYQKIGPDLWSIQYNACSPESRTKIHKLPNILAYPYDYTTIRQFVKTNIDRILPQTFCVHWYNGDNDVRSVLNTLDFRRINPTESTLQKYIQRIMQQTA